MSEWTHRQCTDCWNERNPDRQAHMICGERSNTCCFCGKSTNAGIYVRHDPSDLSCDHTEVES